MGNGAKAQQKQQRNAKKAADSGPKRRVTGQLKVNEAAKTIICEVCKQTFLTTTRYPALAQHAENKHASKTVGDCFPNVKA
ncbi:Zf-met2 domain-containing protein [Ceratobasidium theobromae]|uniref:Zf-met2 domain-containing protein n=1 Tax=Ceratobasidium theobromae TaxID=1582974 RepID=A0A5N5QMY3_9AGAM|nr:Zf-met2 domain-containing protein [Ceratobasidium theobromae]